MKPNSGNHPFVVYPADRSRSQRRGCCGSRRAARGRRAGAGLYPERLGRQGCPLEGGHGEVAGGPVGLARLPRLPMPYLLPTGGGVSGACGGPAKSRRSGGNGVSRSRGSAQGTCAGIPRQPEAAGELHAPLGSGLSVYECLRPALGRARETAYPSTFVIDRKGKVRYSLVSKNHGGRASAADVLTALGQLR